MIEQIFIRHGLRIIDSVAIMMIICCMVAMIIAECLAVHRVVCSQGNLLLTTNSGRYCFFVWLTIVTSTISIVEATMTLLTLSGRKQSKIRKLSPIK